MRCAAAVRWLRRVPAPAHLMLPHGSAAAPCAPLAGSPLQVRMVPQRPGIAFVEYDDAGQAQLALGGLQGFRLATDTPMQISFAKQ